MAKEKGESGGMTPGTYLQSILQGATKAVNPATATATGDAKTDQMGSALASIFGPGFDASALLSGTLEDPMAQEPPTIDELLLGTSMDITGRYSLTGRRINWNNLPRWAQGVGADTFRNNTNLDPYLGIVSEVGDERVYLGDGKFKPKTPKGGMLPEGMTPAEARAAGLDHNDYPKKRKADKTQTVTQVKNQPYLWEQDEVNDAMRKMRQSGLPVKSFDDMVNVWGAMVDRASAMYSLSAGKKKVTPWDVLDMYKSEAKAAGNFTDFESGSQTTTHRTINEVSEGQAWAALQSQLSQMLGRDPSDDELREFAYRMNNLAAKNPTITETITRYKAGNVTSSDSKTRGGFDQSDLVQAAYEDAQDDPEYAEYQAATLYFNSAVQALGALGDG